MTQASPGDAAGTAAMPAVALVPAARPGGLAGAFTAQGSGISALGINPAGLAQDTIMVYSGSIRPGLTRVGGVGYSFPAAGGQWAVSATYVDYEGIVATDENQSSLGTLYPVSIYPALSYARVLGSNLRAGATFKLAHESLGDFDGASPAFGAAFDAGVQYQVLRNLGFGAALTNLGRQFTGYFEDDTHRGTLPGAARAGLFYQPRTQRGLTLVADFEAYLRSSPTVAVGAEYALRPEWGIRAGTRWSADDVRNLMGLVDPNAGVVERGGEAVKLAAGTTVSVGPVTVDYAAQWWRELGVVHALTVAWSVRPAPDRN